MQVLQTRRTNTNQHWEGKMRILFDVLTPKQARMCAAIVNKLKHKYSFKVTARNYAETLNVLEHYGIKEIDTFSSYGNDIYEKYIHSLEREKFLAGIVKPGPAWSKKFTIDLIITQASIEAIHVGVRLGIPTIVLTDVPQRQFLNRQILPSADCHVRESLTHGYWQYHSPSVAWMDACQEMFYLPKEFKRKREPDTIFYRSFEHKSSYSEKRELFYVKDYVKEFCRDTGKEFVPFQRYSDHKFMSPEEIYRRAALIISGGSSMAVEAALLGIPAISFYPDFFPKLTFLERSGYPITKLEFIEKNWFMKILEGAIQRELTDPRPFKDDPMSILEQLLEVKARQYEEHHK